MPKRLTKEEFIKKARNVHGSFYDYSKAEYINNHTKVEIICPEHGSFFQTPHAHIDAGHGCQKCGGSLPVTTEEFVKRAKKVHGNKYDYSEVNYTNMFKKIKVFCNVHSTFFNVEPKAHLNGHTGCRLCANEKFKATSLKIYGETNPAKTELVKSKMKQTCLQKYGTEYPLQSYAYKENLVKNRLENGQPPWPISTKEIRTKIKNTFLEKYGVTSPFLLPDFRSHLKEVITEKYGTPFPSQLPEIKEKMKQTFLENYGVPHPMQVDSLKKKALNNSTKTLQERYGVNHPMQVDIFKSKQKQASIKSNLQKYGVEWPMQSQYMKNYFLEKYGVENPMQLNGPNSPIQKSFETRRKNKTFNTSKPEDELEKALKEEFSEVYRNYNKDPRYPFLCDFYIPEKDLFLEFNAHWTHGHHWFSSNDADEEILHIWQEKAEDGSKYYKNAVEVWTERDIFKRDTAKNNNLNYVVLWNKEDIEDWLALGCPDGHDGDGMYTWKEGVDNA